MSETNGPPVEVVIPRPKGEGLLNLQGLADYWGVEDLDELKRIIRGQGVPYFTLGKSTAKKIHWDRVRFRSDAVRQWEDANQCVYAERQPGSTPPGGERRPRSALRCKGR
jgi:hypothetical protein